MTLLFAKRIIVRDILRIFRKSTKKPLFIVGACLILGIIILGTPTFSLAPQVLGQNNVRQANDLELTNTDIGIIPSSLPVRSVNTQLKVNAEGVAVFDLTSRTYLYLKNGDQHFLPASLTKIATALVALKNCSPEKIIKVANLEIRGSQMGLVQGEEISVENLLYGLFLSSGNDAAKVLADSCFGSDQNAINKEFEFLKLQNSHFNGPTGLEEEYHYISPRDLAQLSAYAYENQFIRKVISQKEITVSSEDKTRWHTLKNLNPLLGEFPGVVGMKTGWTETAGECMVTVHVNGNKKIIIVVLKSSDRQEDTKAIIDWVSQNFQW